MKNTNNINNDFKTFKSWVAISTKVVLHGENEKPWQYYMYGPKESEPIIFIPGVSGTASCFFRQFLSLPAKGHRIISVDAPEYDTHVEWVKGFEQFLDSIQITSNIHIFGVGLGGYLAQVYAAYRPARVLSLMLCNSFADTQYFKDRSPLSFAFHLMPLFMLQRNVLSNFPKKGSREVQESIDFMVDQLESISHGVLSSKMQLNCMEGPLKPISFTKHFDENKISIIQSLNCSMSKSLMIELEKFYPNAKVAFLKDGGDFPFVSHHEEVNMHIEVHLRRIKNMEENPLEEENEEQVEESYSNNHHINDNRNSNQITQNNNTNQNPHQTSIIYDDGKEDIDEN